MSLTQRLSFRVGADNLIDHPQDLFNTFEARPGLLRLNPLEDKYILRGSRGTGKTNLLLVHYYISLALFLVAARLERPFLFPIYANMAFEVGAQQSYYKEWVQHLGKEIQLSFDRIIEKLDKQDWPEVLVNIPLRWLREKAPSWYANYSQLLLEGNNPGGELRDLQASYGGGGINSRISDVRDIIKSLQINNLQNIRDLSEHFRGQKLLAFIDEVSDIRCDIDVTQQYSQIMNDSYRQENIHIKYAVVKDHFTDRTQQGYGQEDLDFDISTRQGYNEARHFILRLFRSICGDDIELDDYLDISEERDDALREIILFSLGHPRASIEVFRIALDKANTDAGRIVLPTHICSVIKEKGNEIETNLIGIDTTLRNYLNHVIVQCEAKGTRYFNIPNQGIARFQRLFWNLEDEPLISRCRGKTVFVIQYSLCLNRGVVINEEHTSTTNAQNANIFNLVLPRNF